MNKLCKKTRQEFFCQDELNETEKSDFKNHINTCKECTNEFKKFNTLTNILDVKKVAKISNPIYWANYIVKLDEKLDKKESKIAWQWLKLKPLLASTTVFLIMLIVTATLFVEKPDKSLFETKNLDEELLVLIESNHNSEIFSEIDMEILNSLDEESLDSILFQNI
ncbi:MAG: hypothetical protein AABY84_05540 [Candidatus Firestonebacteria bacterium]